MNLDKWNKLPADIQRIFLDAGKEIENELYTTVTKDDNDVRNELTKLLETKVLTKEEYAKWSQVGRLVWDHWAKQGPVFVEALNLARKITGK